MPPYAKNSNPVRGELVWKMWFQEDTETLEKISDKLVQMGILNKLGKPYSKTGIAYAAWKWASDHIEEAKADFKKSYEDKNIPWTRQAEENFYRRLMAASSHNYYGGALERWIKQNDLEKYRKYIVYRDE